MSIPPTPRSPSRPKPVRARRVRTEMDIRLAQLGDATKVGHRARNDTMLLNYSEAYQLREDLTAALQQMVQPDPQ